MRYTLTLAFSLLTFTSAVGQVADKIYRGGDIVTINDKQPFAKAVAVKDGKILAVGSEEDVAKFRDSKTQVVDLAGRSMLPGFVDGHGHCFFVGVQSASANLLPPPDHTVNDIAGVQAELRKWAETETAKKFKIIIGFGYDDAQLKEQRHPTRHDQIRDGSARSIGSAQTSGNRITFREASGRTIQTATTNGEHTIRNHSKASGWGQYT